MYVNPCILGSELRTHTHTFNVQTSTYTEVSVQYSPSLCGEKDSNRHLRRGSTRPCQRCLFNIPRACAGKWILTDIFEVAQRGLQTDSSSSRGIWEPKKSPGSSEAEKLSIPNCFVIVLNTFGSPARFQFFWLLATLQLIDRQRQPCRRCLFNIPRACAGK